MSGYQEVQKLESVLNASLLIGIKRKRASRIKGRTGQRFGKLIVEGLAKIENNRTFWECRCDCGNIKTVMGNSLKSGLVKSCGCLKNKHGEASQWGRHKQTTEYRTWGALISRCYNKNHQDYKYYGGRGIRVCDRWRHNFSYFIQDMGRRPRGMSIDRINVNGDYELSNCRWATASTQCNNRRSNLFIEINGIKKTVSEWAKEVGVTRAAMAYRLKYWDMNQLLLHKTPSRMRDSQIR